MARAGSRGDSRGGSPASAPCAGRVATPPASWWDHTQRINANRPGSDPGRARSLPGLPSPWGSEGISLSPSLHWRSSVAARADALKGGAPPPLGAAVPAWSAPESPLARARTAPVTLDCWLRASAGRSTVEIDQPASPQGCFLGYSRWHGEPQTWRNKDEGMVLINVGKGSRSQGGDPVSPSRGASRTSPAKPTAASSGNTTRSAQLSAFGINVKDRQLMDLSRRPRKPGHSTSGSLRRQATG